MSQPQSSDAHRRSTFWVAIAFFACGGVLLFNPLPFKSPVTAGPQLPTWVTDTTPLRQPKLQPAYQVALYRYRCSDCHSIIPPSTSGKDRTALQHREIQLQHGINTACLNCHHRSNRDAFADAVGDEIPWEQPQLLCAKCHGPVYRDWQHGSHGRTNGFWNEEFGQRSRRKCIECHDPHRPSFPRMQPAPGPHALRVDPQATGEHVGPHNPLRLITSEYSAAAEQPAGEDH